MSWGRVAVALGRVTKHAVGAVALPGLLALPAWAGGGMSPGGYSYMAPGYFAGGLSAESSWEQIMKSSTIAAQFPMLNFGTSFVPISAVCADGDSLRIADPKVDNGVRIAAINIPGNRLRTAGNAAPGGGQLPLGTAAVVKQSLQADAPGSVIRHPVSVYRVITQVGGGTNQYVYLFEKSWEVPTCATGLQSRLQTPSAVSR